MCYQHPKLQLDGMCYQHPKLQLEYATSGALVPAEFIYDFVGQNIIVILNSDQNSKIIRHSTESLKFVFLRISRR